MQFRRKSLPRRLGVPTLAGLVAGAGLVLTPAGPPALAAAGDYSYAHAQFMQGSLLDTVDLSSIAEIAGEQAETDGVAPDGPHFNQLNLGLLDAIELPLGDVLGSIPLGTGLGVIGQYANATDDGFAQAGAGLITNNGVIGTPDGPPPQPMELALADLLPVGAIADLQLTIDGVAATARQAAGGPAIRDYALDDVILVIDSPALATIGGTLADAAGPVAEIETALGTIEGALETLLLGAVTVTLPDLQTIVDNIVGDPIENPAYPGLTVDLGAGQVSVDLDALLGSLGECDADGPGGEPAGLSNCPVGYEIINDAVINAIATSLTGIVSSALDELVDDLRAGIDSTAIEADLALVTIDTTVGRLTDADATNDGIVLLGLPLPIGTITATILDPLADILDPETGLLAGLNSELIAPVVSEVVPALEPVLDQVVQLIVNVQETTPTPLPPAAPNPGQLGFTQRALTVELLPGTADLATLYLANATVGPNQEGPPFIDDGGNGLTPRFGPDTGGTTVTVTGGNFTGADAVVLDDTDTDITVVPVTNGNPAVLEPGEFRVDSDTKITFVTPPNEPGPVGVIVRHAIGDSNPETFTFTGFTVDPDNGPEDGGDLDDPSTHVTITGACFTGATDVLFGGTSALGFTVVSDSVITAVPPPGTTGTVDVTVVGTACGDLTEDDAYEYTDSGQPPLDASRFVPVVPCRLLDTRETGEPKPGVDSTRTLQVAGRCNVPDDAIAAAMTLTITESDSRGHLTAWPDGERPVVSNLNYGPNENRANSTVLRLSEAGTIELYTFSSTHLVTDVTGYWIRSSGGTTSGRFVADEPERLLDTRLPGETPFGPFEVRTMPLPAGVPSDATALAINITMDDTLGAGWMAAYPANLTERPLASAVNSDGEGQIRAGSLIVPVSPEGFKLVSKIGGHAVIDYLGYFTGESAVMETEGLFVPQAPDRVADTRIDPGSRIPGWSHIDINTQVPGSAVIVNLTMVEPVDYNWLRAWPAGTPMPATSSVNATTELAVANLAIVGQEASQLSIFTRVDAHAVVDVAGWFYD